MPLNRTESITRTKDHSSLHCFSGFSQSSTVVLSSIAVLWQFVASYGQSGLSFVISSRLKIEVKTFWSTSASPFCPMAPFSQPDVCLKETMTLADRLYNLQLIQEFCKDNLNDCCHFTLEDMLYASSTIKVLHHYHISCCICLFPDFMLADPFTYVAASR